MSKLVEVFIRLQEFYRELITIMTFEKGFSADFKLLHCWEIDMHIWMA